MAKKDTSPRYVVAHDGVGAYRKGATVSARDLGLASDDDNLQRLLDLGALVPEADAPAADVEPMTLAEALRTDSPPTLPTLPPDVQATPEEVAVAVDPNTTQTSGPVPGA